MNASGTTLEALVRQLPKAELHCHLDGSLRASTMLALASEREVTMPAANASALTEWMRVDDAHNLGDYLARFEVTLAVMQDTVSLERIARELVIDAAADGVRYIEVRFCPTLNTRGGLTVDEVMDAVLSGLQQGESESGTMARVIVCVLRSLPWPHAMEMAELSVAFKHRGVVALDLAGGELGNPAHLHSLAFDMVRNNDLSVTIHAGEGDGPASIREAVSRCATDRIGHGTRLFEDPALEAYVVDHQIPLEVCPTSNVQTRVVQSFGDHPLARYRQLGAVVTINTDNRLMSGVTLTEEYLRCMTHLGFDMTDLGALAVASFGAAFLPWTVRQQLQADAHRAVSELVMMARELVAPGMDVR